LSEIDAEQEDDPLEQDTFARLSNPELTHRYLVERRTFRELVSRVERISCGSGGVLSTGNRMFWGSVLFTRISVTAKSIEQILPDPKPGQHWDFSAVASLARNILETCIVYHWLCGNDISEDVRQGRFILLYLHDHGSRRRLFPHQFTEPDPVHEDLVRRFDANPYLGTFDARQRAIALKGEKTPFVQDDVLAEMGVDMKNFRFLYRFFSQHTHSGPIAFYRMAEHGRGTGIETRHEKIYMLIAIEPVSGALSQAIKEHLTIFPDAETRPPYLTRRQIEINVEVEQGRRRKPKD
jgi:hypothetical protein